MKGISMAKSTERRKRTTKAERFYIEHHWMDMTPQELAQELNLPILLVKDHYNKFKKAYEKEQAEKQAEEDKVLRAGKLMGRKKDRGVLVMTKEASQLADEAKKNTPKKQPGCIHEIKPK